MTAILAEPRRRADGESAAEPPLRQIIDVLQQVMCTYDAEKLAISAVEIYGEVTSAYIEKYPELRSRPVGHYPLSVNVAYGANHVCQMHVLEVLLPHQHRLNGLRRRRDCRGPVQQQDEQGYKFLRRS